MRRELPLDRGWRSLGRVTRRRAVAALLPLLAAAAAVLGAAGWEVLTGAR